MANKSRQEQNAAYAAEAYGAGVFEKASKPAAKKAAAKPAKKEG